MSVLVLGGLATSLAGCPKFGGRVQATLASVPAGRPVYLVPLYDWDRGGHEQMLNDEDLRPWRKGTTNAKNVSVFEYSYMLVVDCGGGQYQVEEVAPAKDGANDYEIDCP
ncbi:MAG TPA: hypothetical protein VHE35_04930 [Kofleriaceae bacterium]|nr:hypothetical protein [Kofleriaceae bacterium]